MTDTSSQDCGQDCPPDGYCFYSDVTNTCKNIACTTDSDCAQYGSDFKCRTLDPSLCLPGSTSCSVCSNVVCASKSDCANGMDCISGACTSQVCDQNLLCPEGSVCVDGYCVVSPPDDNSSARLFFLIVFIILVICICIIVAFGIRYIIKNKQYFVR